MPSPSALTPFVRSDAQGALLAELLLHPDVERTVSDMARRTGIPQPTVSREVARLVRSGVVTARTSGRNNLVRANTDHRLNAPMSEIIAATYGPEPVLRELLRDIDGVEEAFIYGSWAQRRRGTEGLFPRDVDVMVIGVVNMDDVLDVAEAARLALGMEVNIHSTRREAWQNANQSSFLGTVRSRPMIPLMTGGGCGAE